MVLFSGKTFFFFPPEKTFLYQEKLYFSEKTFFFSEKTLNNKKFYFVLDEEGIIRSRNYLPTNEFFQDILSLFLLYPESVLLKLILLDIHTSKSHAVSITR